MATGTGSEGYAEGFGQVNNTVGTIFRYALLGATLFGVVVVSIFLVYIANDAIQPLPPIPAGIWSSSSSLSPRRSRFRAISSGEIARR